MVIYNGILYVERNCKKCQSVIDFCERLSNHGIMEYSLVYVGDPKMERFVIDKMGGLNLPFFEYPDGTISDGYGLQAIYGDLLPVGKRGKKK